MEKTAKISDYCVSIPLLTRKVENERVSSLKMIDDLKEEVWAKILLFCFD